MTTCPCCGGTVARPLVVDLETNTVARGDRAIQVEPRTAEILSILADAYPAAVDREKLIDGIWGVGTSAWQKRPTLRRHIERTRPKAQSIGLLIETVRTSRTNTSYRFREI
jgi:DNA-binding response OmpR family regulator